MHAERQHVCGALNLFAAASESTCVLLSLCTSDYAEIDLVGRTELVSVATLL